MRRLLTAVLLSVPLLGLAQDRSAQLDQAAAEARAAAQALRDAEQRRAQGVEAQPGERLGTVGGGSRTGDAYEGRQSQLEREVEEARRRHDEAQKRWNDLK